MSISKRSGKLVEIVHTSNVWGRYEPAGHIDFYVNGGKDQPGCFILLGQVVEKVGCSHNRATAYWIEALSDSKSFIAMRCRSYEDFVFRRRRCLSKGIFVFDYLGRSDFNRSREFGKYYLKTAARSPYGIGNSGVFNEVV